MSLPIASRAETGTCLAKNASRGAITVWGSTDQAAATTGLRGEPRCRVTALASSAMSSPTGMR